MLERYELLREYEGPAYLKEYDYEKLQRLAEEVRDYIIEVTAQRGGHVAPSKGL